MWYIKYRFMFTHIRGYFIMAPTNYSETRYNTLVKNMRSWLYDIARKRINKTVTADDVHTFLDRQVSVPRSVNTRLSFINSVLREPMFTVVGCTASSRPEARGRVISEWSL